MTLLGRLDQTLKNYELSHKIDYDTQVLDILNVQEYANCRIWATLTLLRCADSGTNTKTDKNCQKKV